MRRTHGGEFHFNSVAGNGETVANRQSCQLLKRNSEWHFSDMGVYPEYAL
jgi:uncharacterized protein YegP (UPF0339 family)